MNQICRVSNFATQSKLMSSSIELGVAFAEDTQRASGWCMYGGGRPRHLPRCQMGL